MKKQRNLTKEQNVSLENYKNIFLLLEQIVPILDKIGSRTQDKEKVALLLLLFFKEKNVLDILSNIRKTAFSYLEENLSEDELDNLLEKADENFLKFWQIPKETNKELLIEKIISLWWILLSLNLSRPPWTPIPKTFVSQKTSKCFLLV